MQKVGGGGLWAAETSESMGGIKKQRREGIGRFQTSANEPWGEWAGFLYPPPATSHPPPPQGFLQLSLPAGLGSKIKPSHPTFPPPLPWGPTQHPHRNQTEGGGSTGVASALALPCFLGTSPEPEGKEGPRGYRPISKTEGSRHGGRRRLPQGVLLWAWEGVIRLTTVYRRF